MTNVHPPGFATGIARVVSVNRVSRHQVRLTLESPDIAAMDAGDSPAPAIRLLIPPAGEPVVLPAVSIEGLSYPPGVDPPTPRTFTIRRLDPGTSSLAVEILVGHDGVAAKWAASVHLGDEVGFAGPKRFAAIPEANRHVLIGDDSAIPAIEAMLELFDRRDELAHVAGVVATGHPPASIRVEPRVRLMARPLVRVIEELVVDAGDWIWIAGEATAVRNCRSRLQARDPAPLEVRACGYWRAGTSSTYIDAALLRRTQRLLANGADLAHLDEFALATLERDDIDVSRHS